MLDDAQDIGKHYVPTDVLFMRCKHCNRLNELRPKPVSHEAEFLRYIDEIIAGYPFATRARAVARNVAKDILKLLARRDGQPQYRVWVLQDNEDWIEVEVLPYNLRL